MTFRLATLVTRRSRDGVLLQSLRYTYDPVGNNVELHDGGSTVPIFANPATKQACQPLVSTRSAWDGRYLYGYVVAQTDPNVTASNRLIATSIDGDAPGVFSARYEYADVTTSTILTNDGGLHG